MGMFDSLNKAFTGLASAVQQRRKDKASKRSVGVQRTSDQTKLKEEMLDEEERKKELKGVRTEAGEHYDENLAAKHQEKVKVGNELQNVGDIRQTALAGTLGYDPHKGSGMYQGQQQFVRSNISQAAQQANKAYLENLRKQDEEVTFGSALGGEDGKLGFFDRALMSGFKGPSQKKKKMTEAEAEKALRANLAAGGLGKTIGANGVRSALDAQFEAGRDEAKEQFVKERVKGVAQKIDQHNAKLQAEIDQLTQEADKKLVDNIYSTLFRSQDMGGLGLKQALPPEEFMPIYKNVVRGKTPGSQELMDKAEARVQHAKSLGSVPGRPDMDIRQFQEFALAQAINDELLKLNSMVDLANKHGGPTNIRPEFVAGARKSAELLGLPDPFPNYRGPT